MSLLSQLQLSIKRDRGGRRTTINLGFIFEIHYQEIGRSPLSGRAPMASTI
jgi:hypothetical protein